MPTHTVPQLPRPELRAPLKDPVFGAQITRVTDPSMSPNEGNNHTQGLIHEYSRFPGLSADNQKIVLQVIGGKNRGAWEIRNIATGALLRRIAPQGDPECSWHPTNHTALFYRSGNEIHTLFTNTGEDRIVMRFPQYQAIGTNEEGRPSDDWHYYAFLGKRGDATDIVVVDLIVKKIVKVLSKVGSPDWVSMTPKGTWVVVQWTDERGTCVYERNSLKYLGKAVSDHPHSDFALDAQGNEILVYHATEDAQLKELAQSNLPNGSPIAAVRLFDGRRTILLGDTNTADWIPIITGEYIGWWFTPHFSGIASRAHPGWVLVSTYCAPGDEQHPFTREIFWLKTDGSGHVKHVAHHHSDQGEIDEGGECVKDYFAEPHATSSWDGSVVVFASRWGQSGTYAAYTAKGIPL